MPALSAASEATHTTSSTLAGLLDSLEERHPERDPDELLAEGVVFCADLDLREPLALVMPLATDEERQRLETRGADRGEQLAVVFELLLRLTLRDPLTGLYNRRHFDQRLEQELRRAIRDVSPCSLLVFDVDDFKQINDLQGHDAGDRALCSLAATLCATLRVSDEVARLGGDEFAALLPCTAPSAVLAYVGQRIFEALAAESALSVSIGVAGFDPREPISGHELYRRADQALYAAKRAGKNRIRAFETMEEGPSLAVSAAEKKALLR